MYCDPKSIYQPRGNQWYNHRGRKGGGGLKPPTSNQGASPPDLRSRLYVHNNLLTEVVIVLICVH